MQLMSLLKCHQTLFVFHDSSVLWNNVAPVPRGAASLRRHLWWNRGFIQGGKHKQAAQKRHLWGCEDTKTNVSCTTLRCMVVLHMIFILCRFTVGCWTCSWRIQGLFTVVASWPWRKANFLSDSSLFTFTLAVVTRISFSIKQTGGGDVSIADAKVCEWFQL